ncbi:hypothetical protein Trydic_g2766 [Trypoxylus dichotomus]
MWSVLIVLLGIVFGCLSGDTNDNLCDLLELEIYEQGVSKANAALIVQRHNFYRQSVMNGTVPGQPRGRNIRYLRWDKTLARTAQEVADTCYFRHKTVVDDRWRYKVGQSIYRTEKPFYALEGGNWTRAVERWYLEYKLYRYGPIHMDYDRTGHYTQLIWDRTYLIGCGFIAFENERDSINDIAEIHVCHYGPPGNRFSHYPYRLSRGPQFDAADNAVDNEYLGEYYDEYLGDVFNYK